MKVWSVELFLNISFIKIRFSCNQNNIGEALTQCKKMCLSQLLITGESKFDEIDVQEMFNWSEIHS